MHEKRVLLEEFPVRSCGVMQAFAFNIRRDKFKDLRVRRAFNFAFDFEEMNKQIFFGQYKRISSYFDGTELASSGLPQGRELEILETVRARCRRKYSRSPIPIRWAAIPEAVRAQSARGAALLKEAGYEVRDRKLVNGKTGEPFTVELLVQIPTFERVMLFYKPSLERLGIAVSVRTVDATQYQNRIRSWDFDIVVASGAKSLSPGNEQREYWGSQAADQPGSRNIIGIKNPAIDTLIERVIFAKAVKNWSPQPRRSTACCCGTTMSSRSGPTERTVRRAGIASVGRRNCQNTDFRLSDRMVVGCGEGRARPADALERKHEDGA